MESRTEVGSSLAPLSELIDEIDFPLIDFFRTASGAGTSEPATPGFFSYFYYSDARVSRDSRNITLDFALFVEKALPAASLPGVPGFGVRIGAAGTGWSRARCELKLGADFSLRLYDIGVTLSFPPKVLAKVGSDASDRATPASLVIQSGVVFSFSPKGLEITQPSGEITAELEDCYIAGTELKLKAKVEASLPQKTGGAFQLKLTKAEVTIPASYLGTGSDVVISAEGVTVGPAGLTGTFKTGEIKKLFGLNCDLISCEVSFRDGVLRSSTVKARLHLPVKGKAGESTLVGVEVIVGQDKVTAALLPAEKGSGSGEFPLVLEIENLFRLSVKSLRLAKEGDLWTVYLSGKLRPRIDGAEWPELEFDEIGVDSNGSFVFPDGAGVALASPLLVKWKDTAALTISKFRIGRPKGSKNEVELCLSGSVEIAKGVPAGASVEGLVVTWKPGGPVNVRFDGIGIKFGIPGSFEASLEVAYSSEGQRFKGKGHLNLPALDIAVDILVETGTENGTSYLFLFADAKLFPGGIAIGASGLSLYGLQGLVAHNMSLRLEKEDLSSDRPFLSLFNKEKDKDGKKLDVGLTDRGKWKVEANKSALGFGVLIGTADDGKLFSCRGMLVITLPDLDLILQARATFVQARKGLSDKGTSGTLDALLVYRNADSKLTFDLIAAWANDPLYTVGGTAHASFELKNPLNFLIQLGDEPVSRQVSAKVLRFDENWLFAAGYWMRIDRGGFATGVLISVSVNHSVGGFYARAEGSATARLSLTWSPIQWEGGVALMGSAAIGCPGLNFAFAFKGKADLRAPAPFAFAIELRACWHFECWFASWDLCLGFRFAWERPTPPKLEKPLLAGVSAVPKHWTPRNTGGEKNPPKLDDAVVALVPSAPAGAVTIQPHSELFLEFRRETNDRLPAGSGPRRFGGLNPVPSALKIGEGYYQVEYGLGAIHLVRHADVGDIEQAVYGTWLLSTSDRPRNAARKPNTCLQLFSSARFGRPGSLTGGGVADTGIDYCQPPGPKVMERTCISLSGCMPGRGLLRNGWLYEWCGEGENRDVKRGNEGGVVLDAGDHFTIWVPEEIQKVIVLHRRREPEGSKVEETVEVNSTGGIQLKPKDTGGDNPIPELWLSICFEEMKEVGAPTGRTPTGADGAEEWTLKNAEDRIMVPGSRYTLTVETDTKLTGPEGYVQAESSSFSFTTDRAPNYPNALTNYVAGTYPAPGARPVFLGYQFVVRFRDGYVLALYELDKRPLALRLLDSQGRPLGKDWPLLTKDSKKGRPELPAAEQWWRQLYDRILRERNCVPNAKPVKDIPGIVVELPPLPLLPRQQYTVEIVCEAIGPALASWSFTTSSFQTFLELLGKLEDRIEGPVYAIGTPASGSFDDFARAYGVPTVRTVAATCLTPVQAGGNRIALLLESPEPLDDGSGRLTVTVAGEKAELVPNLDWTRVLVRIQRPASMKLPVQIAWRRKGRKEAEDLRSDGVNSEDEVTAFDLKGES